VIYTKEYIHTFYNYEHENDLCADRSSLNRKLIFRKLIFRLPPKCFYVPKIKFLALKGKPPDALDPRHYKVGIVSPTLGLLPFHTVRTCSMDTKNKPHMQCSIQASSRMPCSISYACATTRQQLCKKPSCGVVRNSRGPFSVSTLHVQTVITSHVSSLAHLQSIPCIAPSFTSLPFDPDLGLARDDISAPKGCFKITIFFKLSFLQPGFLFIWVNLWL